MLAREYGVHLHTHLAETQDEEVFCQEKFGHRPVAYMQSLGWVGEDVWFAHAVHANDAEIQVFAHTGCGVAHCPSSNMRLASGIAPVMPYLAAGVKVGLGVDGSASNDGSHMLAESRQAMLLARLSAAPLPAMARGQNIGAFLLTEPQAGSDTAAFRASARRDGDSFVLGLGGRFPGNRGRGRDGGVIFYPHWASMLFSCIFPYFSGLFFPRVSFGF